jgi:2-iminobutanoate/2-iminopropanoate deaminase
MQTIATTNAPQAIGPYSQGIIAGGLLFTAGQIGLDPQTGTVVDGGVGAQTRCVLANLAAILEAAGTNWSAVVKTTIFLQSMADFQQVNEIYAAVLGDARPARSTVQVAGLPRGVLVEIDAIAAI